MRGRVDVAWQGPAIAYLGVADPGGAIDVSVLFPSRRNHSGLTQPALLANVVPGARFSAVGCAPLVVRDVPTVVAVSLLPSSGVVGIGGVVAVVAVAGFGEAGLVASSSCSLGGVPIAAGMTPYANGTYVFAVTVTSASASVRPGALTLLLQLVDATFPTAVSPAVTHALLPVNAVAIDAVPPVVALSCGPANNSVVTTANFSVCVACGVNGSEPYGCASVLYVVVVTGSSSVETAAPLFNNGSYGNVTLGPFAHRAQPTLLVHAVDVAGNVGPYIALTWTLDLVSPTTIWRVTPPTYSNDSSAQFNFDCSVASCRFQYSFDSGPKVVLGSDPGSAAASPAGGGDASSGSRGAVDTEIDPQSPSRITASRNARLSVYWVQPATSTSPVMKLPLPALANSNATIQVRECRVRNE